jgi:hypothetical protein
MPLSLSHAPVQHKDLAPSPPHAQGARRGAAPKLRRLEAEARVRLDYSGGPRRAADAIQRRCVDSLQMAYYLLHHYGHSSPVQSMRRLDIHGMPLGQFGTADLRPLPPSL